MTYGLSHCDSTIISCCMSSISSSASSRSMILMATTCWVLLSIPLKTSPKLPFPIRSCFVNISSGSTFCNRKIQVSGYYFVFRHFHRLRITMSRVISVKSFADFLMSQRCNGILRNFEIPQAFKTFFFFNTWPSGINRCSCFTSSSSPWLFSTRWHMMS